MAQQDEREVDRAFDAMNTELDSVIPSGEVAVVRNAPAQPTRNNDADRLIEMAIERDADVDKLARLIDLRNREMARVAKQEYEDRFAAMQRSFPNVAKTREAKDAEGRVLYAFAPLEDIVSTVGPVISDHGFRYRFEEERLEKADEKRVWCIVGGFGHEERTYVDVPIPTATKFTNAIQSRGAASSYGKRYAFLAAFGLTIGGEDDDTRSISIAEALDASPGLTEMREAKTLADLKEAFKTAFSQAPSEASKMLIIEAKNRRKEELSGAAK